MAAETPTEISMVGLDDWYSSLDDRNKVKVKRYLADIDTTSKQDFLVDLMKRSADDHNFGLSKMAGSYVLKQDLSDYDRFVVTEAYIDGLFGGEDYEEVKIQCCNNLDLFPAVKDRIIGENNGVLPKTIMCRNRLIDVMVGIDADYDSALEALDEFVSIGIMDPAELNYRRQSLKIHKMQTTFDNVFSFTPKK